MKCFEQLVKDHITSHLGASMDHLQFAYRANRSTEDAIPTLLHLTLTHLKYKNTNARILLVDFSSAFNAILLHQLVEKLQLLGVGTKTCNWVLDFLTERKQTVKIGSRTSNTITVSIGSPQGCVLSPLLFTLLTHDCTTMHNTNHRIKLADDPTIVFLIINGDVSAYRDELEFLMTWCNSHNLSLNTGKTKEIIIDF